MSNAELDIYLEDLVSRGASKALATVGLHDEYAALDITTIRSLLSSLRLFRKGAVTATISGFGRLCGWAIVLGFAMLVYKIGGAPAKAIAEKMMEP